MKTKLLVLAAGIGSRFGGIKQVAPVGPAGESILEYSVFDALGAGFDEVVFLVRKEIEEDFSRTILSRLPSTLRYSLAWQAQDSFIPPEFGNLLVGRTKPWGTGHALLCAQTALENGGQVAFAVINADDYYGREAFSVVHDFLAISDPARSDFCLAGYRLSHTTSPFGPVSRGVCTTDSDGFLVGIEEHLSIAAEMEGERKGFRSASPDGLTRARFTGTEPVSMNLWGFTPAVFDAGRSLFGDFLQDLRSAPEGARLRAEFFLPGIVDSLVRAGQAQVKVLPVSESLFGLTYKEDLDESRRQIARLCEAGRYPVPLWSLS